MEVLVQLRNFGDGTLIRMLYVYDQKSKTQLNIHKVDISLIHVLHYVINKHTHTHVYNGISL